MKATTLILALALATATSGAFAAQMSDGDRDSMTTPAQGTTWEQQNEAQRAQLERAGFPQYNN
jgi:hypothetical protein